VEEEKNKLILLNESNIHSIRKLFKERNRRRRGEVKEKKNERIIVLTTISFSSTYFSSFFSPYIIRKKDLIIHTYLPPLHFLLHFSFHSTH